MIDSQPELFTEPKRSFASKVLAATAALVITALVFAGYAALRKRYAQESGSLALSSAPAPAAPAAPAADAKPAAEAPKAEPAKEEPKAEEKK